MLTDNFLAEFKRTTEENWSHARLTPTLYGFQSQPGTRWNPGLSAEEISGYQRILSVCFPEDFKTFLKAMNGTHLPTLNIHGSSGEPYCDSLGVYSYPKDLEAVRRRIEDVKACRTRLAATMADQGFALAPEDSLVPIYVHRYVVCTADLDSSAVLSIADGDDVIIYGNSLEEYLRNEFLRPPPAHHK